MNRIDKTISVILLGSPIPVALMLLCWWVSVPLFGNNGLMYLLLILAALIIGVILDVTVLRPFMYRLFNLPISALFVLLAFYSLIIYGLFMGLPVFNSFIGIVGVYIVTRSSHIQHASNDSLRKNIKKTNLFSFVLLLLICIATAAIALNEEAIGLELKLMLNVPFDVMPGMIWALILVGTILLLLFQYGVSKFVFHIMIKNLMSNKTSL